MVFKCRKCGHKKSQIRKDFSASSLQYIFVNYISREAKVVTDKWRGYRPIAKVYNITQIESNGGMNFVLE